MGLGVFSEQSSETKPLLCISGVESEGNLEHRICVQKAEQPEFQSLQNDSYIQHLSKTLLRKDLGMRLVQVRGSPYQFYPLYAQEESCRYS